MRRLTALSVLRIPHPISPFYHQRPTDPQQLSVTFLPQLNISLLQVDILSLITF
jgi:hypothetical protein